MSKRRRGGEPASPPRPPSPPISRTTTNKLCGGDFLDNERRHPPQRRLLLRERAKLVATCLEQALSLAQLGLDAAALGRVPSDAVDDAPLGHRPPAPLEPPHGAVRADDAGVEPNQIVTFRKLRQRMPRRLYVLRMDDVESGSREQLRLRVPQETQERRVHALERAVEADDGLRVDREVEELLEFGLALRQMWRPCHLVALLSLPRLSLRIGG